MTLYLDALMGQLIAGEASVLDGAMLAACPVAIAPERSGAFVALRAPGRRILLAKDGVYLEARSQVLSCRVKIADCDLPFGSMTSKVEVIGKPIPRPLFLQLARKALDAHPKEMAAVIVRDADGQDRIIVPEQAGSVGHVRYDDTVVDESRLLIDAHSHGPFVARFSGTDDESDRSRIGPHVSLLFGACESGASMKITSRVCVGSHLIDLDQVALAALFGPSAD